MEPTTQERQDMLSTLGDARTRLQNLGTVSANQLTEPSTPVTVPEPAVAEDNFQPQLVQNVVDQGNQIIAAQTEEAKQLRDLRAQQAGLAGETTLSEMFTQQQEQFGIPENLRKLQDVQNQIAGIQTESLGTQSDIARAAGQTVGQGSRQISAEKARANVRSYGLAAQAAVLQGNIQTATNLVNQAVQTAYQDRTLRNTNLINQINSLQSVVSDQTAQLLEQDRRKYEEDLSAIDRAQSLIDTAVQNGYVGDREIDGLLKISDPTVQAERAQFLINQGVQRSIREQKAAAAAAAQGDGTIKPPTIKEINGRDYQWNDQLGTWEEIPLGAQAVDNSTDNLDFLLDTADRILGSEDKGYDALYKKASQAPIRKGISTFFTGTTGESQLTAYVDTLKSNMLTLATDPAIKEFFGPQMSDADVRLMTAAGSTLQPGDQTPEQLKNEVERIYDLVNRAKTAVQQGVQGQTQQNLITAPDGQVIEIID